MISFSHILSKATVRFLYTGTNSAETANCVCVFVGVMCARVCSSWKEFALQAFSQFLADYNGKYCAFFNQGNAVIWIIVFNQAIQSLIKVNTDMRNLHSDENV